MRKDFQRLADLRVEEAAVLVNTGKQQGAYYLAGFAIECALKACIAKKTRRHQFPPNRDYVNELYRHKIEDLLELAGLKDERDKKTKLDPAFAINWGVVKDWDVESRYEVVGRNGKDMLKAVSSADGVLQWIKQYW
jgi:HEPN domain-containing protein